MSILLLGLSFGKYVISHKDSRLQVSSLTLTQSEYSESFSQCSTVIFPAYIQESSVSHLLEHGVFRLWRAEFNAEDYYATALTTSTSTKYVACQKRISSDETPLYQHLSNFFDTLREFRVDTSWVPVEEKRVQLEEAQDAFSTRHQNFPEVITRTLEDEKRLVYTHENARILAFSDDSILLEQLAKNIHASYAERKFLQIPEALPPFTAQKAHNQPPLVIAEYTFEDASAESLQILTGALRRLWQLALTKLEPTMRVSVLYYAESKALRVYLEGGYEDTLDTVAFMTFLVELAKESLNEKSFSQLQDEEAQEQRLINALPTVLQMKYEARNITSGIGCSGWRCRSFIRTDNVSGQRAVDDFLSTSPAIYIRHSSEYSTEELQSSFIQKLDYTDAFSREPAAISGLIPKEPYQCEKARCYTMHTSTFLDTENIEYVQLEIPIQQLLPEASRELPEAIQTRFAIQEKVLYSVHLENSTDDKMYVYFSVFKHDRERILKTIFSDILPEYVVSNIQPKDFPVTITTKLSR